VVHVVVVAVVAVVVVAVVAVVVAVVEAVVVAAAAAHGGEGCASGHIGRQNSTPTALQHPCRG
jgi:hypothetical protein